ncbi:MAG: GrpB family protein [Geobacteraceae bacterium]|nr:GrpB family protein [Geobacteraceae bacterium]
MDNTARIRLVGGVKVGASPPGDYSFYGNLFMRMTKEVRNTGNLTRYLAFDYLTDENDPITFLGIEVDSIENIPDGMIALDLDNHSLTILNQMNGKISIVWQEDVNWQWLSKSPSICNRGVTGEFSVRVPSGWCGTNVSSHRKFSMTANAYVAPGHTGSDDSVHLVDYDPIWPQQFLEFSGWLRECLGSDVALRVEHFGSTSIPGMIAKPIIDVLVEVPSFTVAKQRTLPLLNNELWEYWWYGNHLTFVRRDKLMGLRSHHVHMMLNGRDLQARVAFRDHLRSHAEDAARYAALKRQLAMWNSGDTILNSKEGKGDGFIF